MLRLPSTADFKIGVAGVVAIVLTAGCAGPSQQPMKIAGPLDKHMSCEQIEHEKKANEALALGIVQGHFNSRRANLAIEFDRKFQVTPAYVALDVDESQVAQLRSVHERDIHLTKLADNRFCTINHSRWIGQGSQDACGLQWAADVRIEDGQLTGSFWRESVEYELRGTLSESGSVESVAAFRRQSAFGLPGPRYLTIDLAFTPSAAEGKYRVEDGWKMACNTSIGLKRHRS